MRNKLISFILQAINRIVRIGQQKETWVHKYLIANTIEERIFSFQSKEAVDGQGDTVLNPSESTSRSILKSPSKKQKWKAKKGDDFSLTLEDLDILLDFAG